MPYPRKLLNDYEELAVDLHPHWWYFAEAVVALVATIILGIVVMAVDAPSGVKWLVLVLIVGSALWVLVRYLRWATTNFVITSDRVIFRHGVVAKSGIEIPLERVNSVHFSQSVFERMIGAGDLLIESGAEGGQQRFTDVKNPDKIQNLIHAQMEQNESRMFHGPGHPSSSAVPPAGASVDVAHQLERLEALRDRGTLTPEEFEEQKQRLLGS
jgi:membrane protein YdbS with pleckstrin-like domain